MVPQLPGQKSVYRVKGLICHVQGDSSTFFTGRGQHRSEEAFGSMMGCFPSAKVVETGPGSSRPNIIKLPVDGPHTAAAVPPPMLNTNTHSLGLNELRDIEK